AVPAGAELDWEVEEKDLVGSVLSGIVLAGDTGQPVDDYGLKLAERTGNVIALPLFRSSREGGGRFTIEGLEDGVEYAVIVSAKGWARAEVPWWTAGPDLHDVTVSLQRPGSLDVEVRDVAGAVAPLASVSVSRQWTVPDFQMRLPVQTNEVGHAMFGELDPGTWHIHAERGAARADADVTVTPGATTRAWLDLAAPER